MTLGSNILVITWIPDSGINKIIVEIAYHEFVKFLLSFAIQELGRIPSMGGLRALKGYCTKHTNNNKDGK